MESIKTSAALSGRFTMYVGFIMIACGGVAMYLYSKRFTKPIEEMALVANQMSNLDFDVKIKETGKMSLGVLERA
jgi:nitrate/nitrite-specific signal transduction histidine kinase